MPTLYSPNLAASNFYMFLSMVNNLVGVELVWTLEKPLKIDCHNFLALPTRVAMSRA